MLLNKQKQPNIRFLKHSRDQLWLVKNTRHYLITSMRKKQLDVSMLLALSLSLMMQVQVLFIVLQVLVRMITKLVLPKDS